MSESTYPSVKDLTLEEKASLTSGGDAWHLQGVESKGIPSYMITDGPHGLRTVSYTHLTLPTTPYV